jgi:translation initiation factor IF-2
MKTTPLLFGIRVIKGQFKVGTLVVAVKGDKQLLLGNITSIQKNKKNVDNMKIGDEICIRIESSGDKLTFGEDFDETYEIQRYITEEEKVVMRFIESLSSI